MSSIQIILEFLQRRSIIITVTASSETCYSWNLGHSRLCLRQTHGIIPHLNGVLTINSYFYAIIRHSRTSRIKANAPDCNLLAWIPRHVAERALQTISCAHLTRRFAPFWSYVGAAHCTVDSVVYSTRKIFKMWIETSLFFLYGGERGV